MAKPYIEIKKARIARSGVQRYSAGDIRSMGLKPATVKDSYAIYRPPEVLLRAMKNMNFIPFVNDHAPEDVTPDNWKQYAVGMFGSSARVEVTDSDEIFITNDLVFYDKSAYGDYTAGKREISVCCDSLFVATREPEKAGYDFLVTDISNVNHGALCDTARAGHSARILDSVRLNSFGGLLMKTGILGKILGLGKTQDSVAPFSKTVFDSAAKISALKGAELDAEVARVMDSVRVLGDSETKEVLVGAVSDCLGHPAEAAAKKDEIAKVLDGLYKKCLDSDTEAAEAMLASIRDADEKADKEKEKEDKEKKDKDKEKEKEGTAKDSAALVEEAVQKALARVSDSIEKKLPDLIDASVKKALGVSGEGASAAVPATVSDSPGDETDTSFLVKDIFGVR
jgi:hypothetical protein